MEKNKPIWERKPFWNFASYYTVMLDDKKKSDWSDSGIWFWKKKDNKEKESGLFGIWK